MTVPTKDDAPILTKTNYENWWYLFVVLMYFCWTFGTAVITFLAYRSLKTVTGYKGTLQKVVLMTVVVAVTRILLFVDPRGWNDIYPDVVREILLRLGVVIILGQWVFIDHTLFALNFLRGDLTRTRSRLGKRQQEITRANILVVLMIVLILLVTILQFAVESIQSKAEKAANVILAIFTFVFTGFGCVLAVGALYALTKVRENSSEADKISSMIFKIAIAVVVAPFLAVSSIIMSLIRGSKDLSPASFFAYLVVRHSTEVVVSFLAIFVMTKGSRHMKSKTASKVMPPANV